MFMVMEVKKNEQVIVWNNEYETLKEAKKAIGYLISNTIGTDKQVDFNQKTKEWRHGEFVWKILDLDKKINIVEC